MHGQSHGVQWLKKGHVCCMMRAPKWSGGMMGGRCDYVSETRDRSELGERCGSSAWSKDWWARIYMFCEGRGSPHAAVGIHTVTMVYGVLGRAVTSVR